MKVAIRERDSVAVVGLQGRITLEDGVESLRRLIRDLLARQRTSLVLDLRRVTEIDSSGLAELLSCREAVAGQGGALKLLRVQRPLAHILRITRLHLVFPAFREESEAVASFRIRAPKRPPAAVLSFRAAA
jgi:anti-anti-sigma factor